MKQETGNRKQEGGLAPRSSSEVGFTLIELIVSFSIFIVLITLTTATFAQTLRTQRIVGDLSVAMNEVSFVTEQMAREMRTGTKFSAAGAETIQFTNANNDQVSYQRINIEEAGKKISGIGRQCIGTCGTDPSYKLLTSPDVKISTLNFILMGDGRANGAWRITIITAVQGPKDINVNLETTISARVIGK